MSLDNAISQLQLVIDQRDNPARWAWRVHSRLRAASDALASGGAEDGADEEVRARDGWLAARAGRTDRDRCRLIERISALGPRIVETPHAGGSASPDGLRHELRRLLEDLRHYRQRLHDLSYDSVELELGGSE